MLQYPLEDEFRHDGDDTHLLGHLPYRTRTRFLTILKMPTWNSPQKREFTPLKQQRLTGVIHNEHARTEMHEPSLIIKLLAQFRIPRQEALLFCATRMTYVPLSTVDPSRLGPFGMTSIAVARRD